MEKNYNKLASLNLKPITLKKTKSSNIVSEKVFSPNLKKVYRSNFDSKDSLPEVKTPRRRGKKKNSRQLRNSRRFEKTEDIMSDKREREFEILANIAQKRGSEVSELTDLEFLERANSARKKKKKKKSKGLERRGSLRSVKLKRDSSLDLIMKTQENESSNSQFSSKSPKKKSRFSKIIKIKVKKNKEKKHDNDEDEEQEEELNGESFVNHNFLPIKKSRFAVVGSKEELDDNNSKEEKSSKKKSKKQKKNRKRKKKKKNRSKDLNPRINYLLDVFQNCTIFLIFFSRYKKYIEKKSSVRKNKKKMILGGLLKDRKIFKLAKKLVLDYLRPDLEDVIQNSENLNFGPDSLKEEENRSELYVIIFKKIFKIFS